MERTCGIAVGACMIKKRDMAVKVEQRPREHGAWQVVGLEPRGRPFVLIIFHGADAEALAIEYAAAKFMRVQVLHTPSAAVA
jgi:hypothetical protein